MSIITITIIVAILLLMALTLVSWLFIKPDWQHEYVTVLPAKAVDIYPLLSDMAALPKWLIWSPSIDPSTKYRTTEITQGLGAQLSWTSDRFDAVLTVIEVAENTEIQYHLSVDNGAFILYNWLTLSISGDQTQLAWRITHQDDSVWPNRRFTNLIWRNYFATAIKVSAERIKTQL